MPPLLVGGFLVFVRVAALIMTLPGVAGGAMPSMARLGLALPLAVTLYPTVDLSMLPDTLGAILGAVVLEALLGVAMGTGVTVLHGALAAGAEVAGMKMGLNMGMMLDPLSMAQQGALGTLAGWLATAVFLGADLHLACLQALAASFGEVRPGGVADLGLLGPGLLDLVQAATIASFQLVGPVVEFLLLVNLGLLVLGRMASNLQIFFGVGTSLTVVVGLGILGLALPAVLSVYARSLAQAPDWILRIAGLVAGG